MVAVVIPSIRYINNNLFFIFIASLLSPEPMVLPITTEEALDVYKRQQLVEKYDEELTDLLFDI